MMIYMFNTMHDYRYSPELAEFTVPKSWLGGLLYKESGIYTKAYKLTII